MRLVPVLIAIVLLNTGVANAGTLGICKWYDPSWDATTRQREVSKRIDGDQGKSHEALNEIVRSGLRGHKVWPTMTQDQACLAWGLPIDVNRTVTENSVWEQWVYRAGSYLYFRDGILVAIQQ